MDNEVPMPPPPIEQSRFPQRQPPQGQKKDGNGSTVGLLIAVILLMMGVVWFVSRDTLEKLYVIAEEQVLQYRMLEIDVREEQYEVHTGLKELILAQQEYLSDHSKQDDVTNAKLKLENINQSLDKKLFEMVTLGKAMYVTFDKMLPFVEQNETYVVKLDPLSDQTLIENKVLTLTVIGVENDRAMAARKVVFAANKLQSRRKSIIKVLEKYSRTIYEKANKSNEISVAALAAASVSKTELDQAFAEQAGKSAEIYKTQADIVGSDLIAAKEDLLELEELTIDANVRATLHDDIRSKVCAMNKFPSDSIGALDDYRGYYDIDYCQTPNRYCRWLGSDKSGGDPRKRTKDGDAWWSCTSYENDKSPQGEWTGGWMNYDRTISQFDIDRIAEIERKKLEDAKKAAEAAAAASAASTAAPECIIL
jgi:hypothetical protein